MIFLFFLILVWCVPLFHYPYLHYLYHYIALSVGYLMIYSSSYGFNRHEKKYKFACVLQKRPKPP